MSFSIRLISVIDQHPQKGRPKTILRYIHDRKTITYAWAHKNAPFFLLLMQFILLHLTPFVLFLNTLANLLLFCIKFGSIVFLVAFSSPLLHFAFCCFSHAMEKHNKHVVGANKWMPTKLEGVQKRF